MRTLDEANKLWQITIDASPSLAELKQHVRPGAETNPCLTGLRSICWKTFLLFRTTDTSKWSPILKDSRDAYASLKEHLLRYIKQPEALRAAADPLDDIKESPWNTLRKDEELRAEILQDVERCMPDEPFFRLPETQSVMLDVLFIFCKLNQDVGYRQGMHEILAPIIWVVDQDAVDLAGGDGSDRSQVLASEALDAQYIEHDAFTMFALVMQTAKSFYELGEPDKRASTQSVASNDRKGTAPIVARSKQIHEIFLASVDPDLATHLTEIEILPQIFLIRWIRLLFGREFPFVELLKLWDTLFAEDPALDLVDLICVAMLLRIRWQLINADYSTALSLLLKYPSPEAQHGPQTFVEDAVYLKDNLNTTGGKHVITKYSKRSPSPDKSRPSSAASLTPKQTVFSRRSPLPSPASFIRQQGGVGALLQGAAKDFYERGEKLGINKAVRDAMDEVKKNMETLAQPPSHSRNNSDVARWSLDEGRNVPSARQTIQAMESRNRQLGLMLNEALKDLRAASAAASKAETTTTDTIDIAIAKIQFVQVYLADSSMPLPSEEQDKNTALKISPLTSSLETPSVNLTSSPKPMRTTARHIQSRPPRKDSPASLTESAPIHVQSNDSDKSASAMSKSPSSQATSSLRPQAPVPTRSTLAQSSFAWMLETDEEIPGGMTKPKAPNTFGHARKPTSGSRREKAAFLFGDDTEDLKRETSPKRSPSIPDPDEGYNLGTMRGPPKR